MNTGAGSASSSSARQLGGHVGGDLEMQHHRRAPFRLDVEAEQRGHGVDEGGGIEGFAHALIHANIVQSAPMDAGPGAMV